MAAFLSSSRKDALKASDTLRGVEFYNFGAFFSRAYRENNYLWGASSEPSG